MLARRWGLPKSVASVIERHHADDCDGETAIVRLADMLAHYVLGGTITPAEMLAVGRAGRPQPGPAAHGHVRPAAALQRRPARARSIPCPMSTREVDVLRRLAKGMVYKQIAGELGLSTSTVRTHLHNVYGKLGAMDRAQAVLIATERGWI